MACSSHSTSLLFSLSMGTYWELTKLPVLIWTLIYFFVFCKPGRTFPCRQQAFPALVQAVQPRGQSSKHHSLGNRSVSGDCLSLLKCHLRQSCLLFLRATRSKWQCPVGILSNSWHSYKTGSIDGTSVPYLSQILNTDPLKCSCPCMNNTDTDQGLTSKLHRELDRAQRMLHMAVSNTVMQEILVCSLHKCVFFSWFEFLNFHYF